MEAGQVKNEFQGDGNRGGFRGRGGGGRGGRGRGDSRGGRGGGGGRWGQSRFDNNNGRREYSIEENEGDSMYGSYGGGNDGGGGGGVAGGGGGMAGPATNMFIHRDEPAEKKDQKKFTGRCRLFVGNIPNDMDEEAFKELFTSHGEVSEAFISKGKGFGFIRLDTRIHAQQAKEALDGTESKGRVLRVRFATHGAALKIKHLPNNVSNELLEEAFISFGEIERSVVIVDEKGKSTGEGIVEFARRPGASKAIQACTDGVLLMTSSPRPVTVEPLMQLDEEDGLPERLIPKNNLYMKDRAQGPRFPPQGTFEHDFGQRWKQLYEMEAKEKERLKKEMEDAIEKLEMEMTNAQHEHHANKLREELRRIEEMKVQDERRLMEMMARRQDQEEERRRMIQQQQQQFGGFMDRRHAGGNDQQKQQQLMMMDPGMARMRAGSDAGVKTESEGENTEAAANQSVGDQTPRQTRFDQPPPDNFRGGMMGGGRDLMRERMMERRDNRPREDFNDNKRGRRF